MSYTLTTDIAETILEGFDKHYRIFRDAARAAKDRFERADWNAAVEAVAKRLRMYDDRVREAVENVRERFPAAGADESLWPHIKLSFIGLLYNHRQPECAETFYNSVACRVLHRRYYNNENIFWRPAVSTEHLDGEKPTYDCYYPPGAELKGTFRQILRDCRLRNPFQDLDRDLGFITATVAEFLPDPKDRRPNFQIQILSSLFYRNKAAYVVGRALNGNDVFPLILPLLQDEQKRLYVDTVLTDPSHVGRLLSLARAYFMVDMEVPSAYVEFLQSLVPTRPKAELYTLIGLQKQGKTLFYRDLQRHLIHSSDQFVLAPGVKGMVMIVFTLPSFAYVFKVIRDWFSPPKESDEAAVREKYLLVKHHDRVGRMADTLEFSEVAFPRDRFDPALLEEFERLAPTQIERDGDNVVIKHLYVERRLVPLDMFLATADEAQTREGISEYGYAVKDLASANIFPGDLLLKNFGMTRYGRVVFYDYDEIAYLTDCRFRQLPSASNDHEETSGEPWYSVDAHDIFPEQFPTFLFPPGKNKDLFMEMHGELADPRFWISRQERLRAGYQESVFPYPEEIRFKNRRR
ncbi:MAG: bifunctional isocitrate dehydrogenase kinase/phosphatase [Myxococcaceae bacterium]